MNLKEKEEIKSWKIKYKEHVCVLEVKGHAEEQNEFFHIKDLVEDIFKTEFSTFSPIIQWELYNSLKNTEFWEKRYQLPALQPSNSQLWGHWMALCPVHYRDKKIKDYLRAF